MPTMMVSDEEQRHLETRRKYTKHGTLSGYFNWSCRCDLCSEFAKKYNAEMKEARKSSLEPGDPRHGTANGYANYHCRCDLCKAAQSEVKREYRALSEAARKRARDARRAGPARMARSIGADSMKAGRRA